MPPTLMSRWLSGLLLFLMLPGSGLLGNEAVEKQLAARDAEITSGRLSVRQETEFDEKELAKHNSIMQKMAK